jgi:hypothetical protein
MTIRPAAVLLYLSAAAAQTALPPDPPLLSRIKAHMKQHLEQMPNYTCLETFERAGRARKQRKFKAVDTIRMEVAEVDGKELFARPGRKFEVTDPGTLANGGPIANGIFSLHAEALFASDSAAFTYAGEEETDGAKLARYNFSVPLTLSGYKLKRPPYESAVAYRGAFWADPQTFDAIHLRIVAEQIPSILQLLDATLEIEYQRVQFGNSEALLPKRADLVLTDSSGAQDRSLVTFSNCRQYGSDSVLTFK